MKIIKLIRILLILSIVVLNGMQISSTLHTRVELKKVENNPEELKSLSNTIINSKELNLFINIILGVLLILTLPESFYLKKKESTE